MPISQIYECDLCGFKSKDLNHYFHILVEKHPNKYMEIYLCEEKCWKLFRKFFKDANRDIEEELNESNNDSNIEEDKL